MEKPIYFYSKYALKISYKSVTTYYKEVTNMNYVTKKIIAIIISIVAVSFGFYNPAENLEDNNESLTTNSETAYINCETETPEKNLTSDICDNSQQSSDLDCTATKGSISCPSTTKPVMTSPSTTKPAATSPSTTKPAATSPSTTKPATTSPSTTKPATTSPSTTQNSFESQVVALVNKERAKQGLSPLTENKKLSDVARLKSQDMHDKKYFSHNSPTYGSPFDMMKSFGISYKTAGENIAQGYTTPEKVMDGWMNSPGHRANILNASFTQIGVGYVSDGHYWTQQFIG